MGADWTIDELCERISRALVDDDAPDSARIRAVPDLRAIRYYISLGLLDRPLLRGRTALYGPRHLAQLIAIKREQTRGRSLAEIQRSLPTLDDAALTAMTGIKVAAAPRAAGRANFWRSSPAPATAPAPTAVSPAMRVELELGDGVRLSFQPTRSVTDADISALRAAGAAAVAELIRRHLIHPSGGNS